MTVKELVFVLQTMPQDAKVAIELRDSGGSYGEVTYDFKARLSSEKDDMEYFGCVDEDDINELTVIL